MQIVELTGTGKTLVELVISITGRPSIIIRKEVRGRKRALDALKARGAYIHVDEADSLIGEVSVNLEDLRATASVCKDVITRLN